MKWSMRFAPILGMTGWMLAACRGQLPFANRACDANAPLELPAEQRDSLRPANTGMDIEAQWARLARTAPGGFAGVYFEQVPRNSQGLPVRRPRVVIRLARPAERGAALHALLPQLPATFGGLAIDSTDVLIVPSTWDFAQLYEWRRFLDARASGVGVSTVDTDEVNNRISYGVRDAAARTALEARLRDLHVPCGLVTIEVSGTAVPTRG